MSTANAVCPHCGRVWDRGTEQHACIELFSECIVCRFMPDGRGSRSGTEQDIDAIQAKQVEILKGSE